MLWWTRRNGRFMIHMSKPLTGAWPLRAVSAPMASRSARMCAATNEAAAGSNHLTGTDFLVPCGKGVPGP